MQTHPGKNGNRILGPKRLRSATALAMDVLQMQIPSESLVRTGWSSHAFSTQPSSIDLKATTLVTQPNSVEFSNDIFKNYRSFSRKISSKRHAPNSDQQPLLGRGRYELSSRGSACSEDGSFGFAEQTLAEVQAEQ